MSPLWASSESFYKLSSNMWQWIINQTVAVFIFLKKYSNPFKKNCNRSPFDDMLKHILPQFDNNIVFNDWFSFDEIKKTEPMHLWYDYCRSPKAYSRTTTRYVNSRFAHIRAAEFGWYSKVTCSIEAKRKQKNRKNHSQMIEGDAAYSNW